MKMFIGAVMLISMFTAPKVQVMPVVVHNDKQVGASVRMSSTPEGYWSKEVSK